MSQGGGYVILLGGLCVMGGNAGMLPDEPILVRGEPGWSPRAPESLEPMLVLAWTNAEKKKGWECHW